MHSFTEYNTLATIKKLSTYSGDKSSYAVVSGTTIAGFFSPVSPDMNTQALGIVSQAYQFVTDTDQDIDDGDILTINSVDYGVKGTAIFELRSISFLRCLLEKPINN